MGHREDHPESPAWMYQSMQPGFAPPPAFYQQQHPMLMPPPSLPPQGYAWPGALPHDLAWSRPYQQQQQQQQQPPWTVPIRQPFEGRSSVMRPPFAASDPTFMHQGQYNGLRVLVPDHQQSYTKPVQVAPLPRSPRGPPYKPKQSDYAVWVGNLPPLTTVIQLKDFFSSQATETIDSVFLITKTNCAFVNYKTEKACLEAVQRFGNCQFYGNRLVCRMRRGSLSSKESSNQASNVATTSAQSIDHALSPSTSTSSLSASSVERHATPLIVDGNTSSKRSERNEPADDSATTTTTAQEAPEVAVADFSHLSISEKTRAKFFILKSLTLQDLLVSTRDGAWITQPHNEDKLNEAFRSAENVYLFFSVNKSGQYFGCARMESGIDQQSPKIARTKGPSSPVASSSTQRTEQFGQQQQQQQQNEGGALVTPTPATDTAPRGRIIDDSARGTIFWEAETAPKGEQSEGVDGVPGDSGEGRSDGDEGRQFAIKWVSTTQVPFHATRGLRNPLNSNREVKIARDGTEVDERVGWRMLQMFGPLDIPG